LTWYLSWSSWATLGASALLLTTHSYQKLAIDGIKLAKLNL
jgi:hypothetical protein